jgi:cytochrome P450
VSAAPAVSPLRDAALFFLLGNSGKSPQNGNNSYGSGGTDPYVLPIEAPVLRTAGGWLISGHAEVSRLAGDRRLIIDPRVGDPPIPVTQSERLDELFGNMVNFRDGESHTRLRRLVAVAFSARRARADAATVDAVVTELVGAAIAAGEFDAVTEIAELVPVTTTCALLGLPRADWPRVVDWAMAMTAQLMRFGQSPDELAGVERQLDELTGYVRELAEQRRGRTGDLIADLLAAADEGDRLSYDEFVAFVVLLFMNGLDTVTAAITGSIGALAWQEGLADLVRREPDRAEDVFNELTRLHSPVRMGARRATEPIEVAGETIGAGEPVFLGWALANRDPRVFAEPDEFRPGRPGRSLAFGAGPHHCLGAALAGRQGGAVLRAFATRSRLVAHTDEATTPKRAGAAIAGFRELRVTALPITPGAV